MFRQTTVIDGMSYLSSIVVRADGSVEVWMKHFLVDEDDCLQDTTHKTFTLVTHLRLQEPKT